LSASKLGASLPGQSDSPSRSLFSTMLTMPSVRHDISNQTVFRSAISLLSTVVSLGPSTGQKKHHHCCRRHEMGEPFFPLRVLVIGGCVGGYSQPSAQSERYPLRLCRSDGVWTDRDFAAPPPKWSRYQSRSPSPPHQRRVTTEDPDSVHFRHHQHRATSITSANPALRPDPSRRRPSPTRRPVIGAGAMEGFHSIRGLTSPPHHSGLCRDNLPSPRDNLTLCAPRYFVEEPSVLPQTQAGLGMEFCDG
jgi:hypothetical protein